MRSIRRWKAFLCLMGLLYLSQNCKKKEQIDGVLTNLDIGVSLQDSTKAAFDAYVRGLKYYANKEAQAFHDSIQESNTGDAICSTVQVKYAPEFNELYLLDPTNNVIFVSNMLGGYSIVDGTNIPINSLHRDSVTISLSAIANSNGSTSTKVLPTLSSVRNGINQLLHQVAPNSTTAFVNFEIVEINSEKAVQSSIGVNLSGWEQKIQGSYNWSNTDKTSKFMIKFYQKYYTVDVDKPEYPSNWFKRMPDVNSWGNISPVYISSITYGRAVYFMMESSFSRSDVEATLNAAFKGWGATADINLSTKQKTLIEQSSIKALIVGGSGSAAVGAIQGISGLKKYLETGGDFSINSPGAPIAYTMRFLKDNSLAKLVLGTEYKYHKCEPMKKLDITLKGISIDGVHNGDCTRVWGNVDLEVWETENGILNKKILPIKENGQMEDVSRMMNWTSQDVKPINDYYRMSNYQEVVNVDRTWSFKVNPKKLNNNEAIVVIKTNLGSAHKGCDLCTDFTRNAGMSEEKTQRFDLKTLIEIKEKSPRTFTEKDGPFIAGPYIGAHQSHHGHRVHFDINKN